jgi:hypothetical protein
VGEIDTSRLHALFAIHVFMKHRDVQKVFGGLQQVYAVQFQERFPVPPHFVDVFIQIKHEHWETYHIRAMF